MFDRFHPHLLLLARLLLSPIFLFSGVAKITNWSGTATHMAEEGMPAAHLLLAGAVAIELGAGLGVLLGCGTCWSALALIAFLVPATLVFHDFWAVEGDARQNQMQHFMKNLTIIGGLLALAAVGGGRFSVDGWRRAAPAPLTPTPVATKENRPSM